MVIFDITKYHASKSKEAMVMFFISSACVKYLYLVNCGVYSCLSRLPIIKRVPGSSTNPYSAIFFNFFENIR